MQDDIQYLNNYIFSIISAELKYFIIKIFFKYTDLYIMKAEKKNRHSFPIN